LFELFSDNLLSQLPLYYEAKIAFVAWLVLPQFQGATILYSSVVTKYLELYEPEIDKHMQTLQDRAGIMLQGLQRSAASQVRNRGVQLLAATTQLIADAASIANNEADGGRETPGQGSSRRKETQQSQAHSEGRHSGRRSHHGVNPVAM
jgi:TB2/DP1, HVA22 family